jgi:hypothetical protein
LSTLLNFPMVSQLTQITSDGRPSENAPYDCVAASIGAAILWYQGKSQWDQDINPDKLKDAAYGENWKNQGTAASAYVAYVASLGYKLYSVNGLVGQLPGLAHEYLAKNLPVIFTERDPYVPASYGWSHVCVWYSDSPGQLTALDPYIGKPITRSDQEWVTELIGNELWIVEEENVTIDISNPAVATYYKPLNDHQWQCIQTGKILQYGVLSAYKTWGNSGLCGLTYLGLVLSNEYAIDPVKYPGVVIVFFERGVLIYDPKHLLDNPPGAGSVYAAHLYSGPGQDPRLATAYQQIQQLQAQLAAQPPAQNPQAGQALVDMQQIKAIAGKY